MTGCKTERRRAAWLRGGRDGFWELRSCVIDVGAKIFGVEEQAQDAGFEVHATVGELGGSNEGDGVSAGDGVEFVFQGSAV